MSTLAVSWEDPRELAQAGTRLSGLEFLTALRDGDLPPAPFANLLGMELVEVEHGRTVFAGMPGEQHYNPIGVVHAGLAATLLDSAMGCAVQSTLPAGTGFTTLELKLNLVRAITSATGRISAEGTIVHRGARTATAEGRLTQDSTGKLLAHATTTCILLS
jgi:uncharacterized protein (TIGR00369 family)